MSQGQRRLGGPPFPTITCLCLCDWGSSPQRTECHHPTETTPRCWHWLSATLGSTGDSSPRFTCSTQAPVRPELLPFLRGGQPPCSYPRPQTLSQASPLLPALPGNPRSLEQPCRARQQQEDRVSPFLNGRTRDPPQRPEPRAETGVGSQQVEEKLSSRRARAGGEPRNAALEGQAVTQGMACWGKRRKPGKVVTWPDCAVKDQDWAWTGQREVLA